MIAWSHPCSAGFTLRGEHSEPSGKPVIHFLHGNGYCGRVYWPMLQLLEADFDIFISDVQGHGDTDHGGRFHGWMMGQEPASFSRAVLLDPVLFTPVMVGAVVLSDVVGLYKRNAMASKARERRRHWPDRATAYANFHERGMFKGWTPEALQAYVDYALKDAADGGVELKCRPSREADIFGSFPRRLWSSLEKVNVPVKVEYGEKSFPFIARSVKRWVANNPQIQSEPVPGGHCYMQEDPLAAAQRIKAFLLAA
jgi:pimeloyl-ACP methyl ester carboxylesterase